MINRELRFTLTADEKLDKLENTPALSSTCRQVHKVLGYLETNPNTNSLHTHPYKSLSQYYGVKVFESYIQQNTPGAYRVFWYYGPDETNDKGKRIPIITIIDITPHP
jgi:hypothetical protein